MTLPLWLCGTMGGVILGMGVSGYPHDHPMPHEVAIGFMTIGAIILVLSSIKAGSRDRSLGHD